MIRWLIGLCAVLGALCAVQGTTLARLKTDLATADARAYRAALVELRDRREEFSRVMTWLDAFVRRDQDLARPGGLCPDGAPDTEAIGAWVFDVYLRERSNGLTEVDARQKVVDAIRQPGRPHP
jgi:hypothetical protein